jgi:hypothetical protein
LPCCGNRVDCCMREGCTAGPGTIG